MRKALIILLVIGATVGLSAQKRLKLRVEAPASEFTGGILELATTTTTRTRPTWVAAGGSATTRGCITLPAPYSTRVCKLTDNTVDCGGVDCVQQEGYSQHNNCNIGTPIVKCFIGLQNTTFVTIFSINTVTGTINKDGQLASSGPLSGLRGSLWKFDPSSENRLIGYPRDSRVMYCDVTALPCNSPTVMFDVDSAGAVAASGYDHDQQVGEIHLSHDGDVIGISLVTRDAPGGNLHDRGCLFYKRSTDHWDFVATIGDTVGNVNCYVALSGLYVTVLDDRFTNGQGVTDFYNYPAMTLIGQLSDACGSGGHASPNWLGYVAADNNSNLAGDSKVWRGDFAMPGAAPGCSEDSAQGRHAHYMTTFSPNTTTQLSFLSDDGTAGKAYGLYAGNADNYANPSQPREQELMVTTFDGTTRVLVMSPLFSNVSTGGGFDWYNRAPKPNINPIGTVAFWIGNMDGSAAQEAFLALDIDQAGAKVLAWSGAPPPQPYVNHGWSYGRRW